MNVLVVEDDEGIATLLELVLTTRGHTVQKHTSDFEGTLTRRDWLEIDAVICDQDLGGFDGKSVFRFLASAYPKIRRVMLTGSSLIDEKSAAADLVLIKPINSQAILASIGGPDD